MFHTAYRWRHDFDKYDGCIVEVIYDPSVNPEIPWRFVRFRDDKPHANHHTVVEKIKQSIFDGITEEQARIFNFKSFQTKIILTNNIF